MCIHSFGTVGQALGVAGSAARIGGSLLQGASTAGTARLNARLLARQRDSEAALNAIEDARTRERFRSALARQTAELAARGISLDSPTALLLAEEGGRELAFASREVRTRGAARAAELSAAARAVQARGRLAAFTGGTNAAAAFLEAAPDIWPGLSDARLLQ